MITWRHTLKNLLWNCRKVSFLILFPAVIFNWMCLSAKLILKRICIRLMKSFMMIMTNTGYGIWKWKIQSRSSELTQWPIIPQKEISWCWTYGWRHRLLIERKADLWMWIPAFVLLLFFPANRVIKFLYPVPSVNFISSIQIKKWSISVEAQEWLHCVHIFFIYFILRKRGTEKSLFGMAAVH